MNEELDFNRWELAVGKIVMSLSCVEGELLMKYQCYFSKTKYFDATFNERLSAIRNLYEQECGKCQSAAILFEGVSKATAYRNLVAHNPVYADVSGDVLKFNISIVKGAPISVDIDTLEKEAERIWSLCNDFSVLLRIWAKN